MGEGFTESNHRKVRCVGSIRTRGQCQADRGFDIGDVLEARVITLNNPPFLGECDQLSSREVEETRRIASLRFHVERAIGRMKDLEYFIQVSL